MQRSKKVIFIASDLKKGGVQGVERGLSEAVTVAGWRMDTLDGSGSVKDQLSALNQAFAQQLLSGYVVVTSDNIVLKGGNNNEYDPQNNYQNYYKAIWGVEAGG